MSDSIIIIACFLIALLLTSFGVFVLVLVALLLRACVVEAIHKVIKRERITDGRNEASDSDAVADSVVGNPDNILSRNI